MTKYRIYAVYFALLAVAILIWWVIILTSENVRSYFFLGEFGENKFALFLYADLLVVALGSGIACWLAFQKSRNALNAAIWFVTGAMSYATVCTISLWRFGDCTWLSVLVMSGATIGCLWLGFRSSGFLLPHSGGKT